MDHSNVLFFLFARKHQALSCQIILFILVSIENIHPKMFYTFLATIKIQLYSFKFPLEFELFLLLLLGYFPLNDHCIF